MGNVPEAAAALRTQVAAQGGRIVEDNVSGSGNSWSGNLKLRLPPYGYRFVCRPAPRDR